MVLKFADSSRKIKKLLVSLNVAVSYHLTATMASKTVGSTNIFSSHLFNLTRAFESWHTANGPAARSLAALSNVLLQRSYVLFMALMDVHKGCACRYIVEGYLPELAPEQVEEERQQVTVPR